MARVGALQRKLTESGRLRAAVEAENPLQDVSTINDYFAERTQTSVVDLIQIRAKLY